MKANLNNTINKNYKRISKKKVRLIKTIINRNIIRIVRKKSQVIILLTISLTKQCILRKIMLKLNFKKKRNTVLPRAKRNRNTVLLRAKRNRNTVILRAKTNRIRNTVTLRAKSITVNLKAVSKLSLYSC